jgi:phospholipid/cholesterol/gamma-HCH transport system substrate-binding protein
MQPGRRPALAVSRRGIIAALLAVAAVVVIVLLASGGGSDDDTYRVRAVFDNGGFMVTGEQVRVAGANVGTIESVDVSMPDDIVAYDGDEPVRKAGKAIIVMDIADPGFQDFRSDASCQIRPQSLIGEKFVDCRPTLPRAPGTPPPPALKEIPDGEDGAGQHLLPLGSSGTSVDPDLINDIQSLPYAQRFRLILNELGAGLAGRGEDIEVLVKRANPVLRDVDRLFGVLSAQRDELAQLASDSDKILGPFSRERASVAGFFSNAGAAAQASAEKGPELEESLRKLPTFLREFRLTMGSLQEFSDAATPVFTDLGKAAPSLTDATRTLTPFSEATTVSLKSLGASGEAAGPIFREAEPIVRKTTALSQSGVVPTRELAALFTDLEKTKGWDALVELIYNTTAAFNGFDQYGHYGRTLITLTNCVDYESRPAGSEGGGCASRFNGPGAVEPVQASTSDLYELLFNQLEGQTGGTGPGAGPATGIGQAGAAAGEAEGGAAGIAEAAKTGGTAPLMDYLLGP